MSLGTELSWKGADAFAAEMGRVAARLRSGSTGLLGEVAGKIRDMTVAASPVDTGTYKANWVAAPGPGDSVIVGNASPQARRLEFGFHGTDSLGRSYNQAPRPHLGPAVEAGGQLLDALLKSLLDG